MNFCNPTSFYSLLASRCASLSSLPTVVPRPSSRHVFGRFAPLLLGAMIAQVTLLQTSSVLAVPVIIDDFSAPVAATTYVISMNNTDPYVLKQLAALGGERDLLVDVLGTSTSISAVGMVGAGDYVFGTSGSVATQATLQYDGVDALDTATSLVNAQGLANLDITDTGNNNGFRLEFSSLDAGAASSLSVRINATSAGGGTASFFGAIPQNPNSSNYDVLFSAFSTAGGFNFGAVTSLQFSFNEVGTKDADFQLTEISTRGGLVPEPSTWVLLAGGSLSSLALLRRRDNR